MGLSVSRRHPMHSLRSNAGMVMFDLKVDILDALGSGLKFFQEKQLTLTNSVTERDGTLSLKTASHAVSFC